MQKALREIYLYVIDFKIVVDNTYITLIVLNISKKLITYESI